MNVYEIMEVKLLTFFSVLNRGECSASHTGYFISSIHWRLGEMQR
jgi:hypothetical protein